MAKHLEEIIKKQLSEMSDEEILSFLRSLGLRRNKTKASSPRTRAVVGTKKGRIFKLMSILEGLSEEERKLLLGAESDGLLGGGDEE